MAQPDVYLTFDGNCADAMHFYERVLGGKLEMMMTMGESPMAAQMPPGAEYRIMHATLSLSGRRLMASDCMIGHPYTGMHGFSLSLSFDTVEQGRPIFDTLAEGGQVRMPLQKTFWAEGFGMLVDSYGTPWMINCGQTPA